VVHVQAAAHLQGERGRARGQPSVGSEYLYFDSTGTHPPALSAHKLGSGGALPATLDALYPLEEKRGGTLGWICYNDERPPTSGRT
jgi:hypothetical protein